jgi:hypothetical protein
MKVILIIAVVAIMSCTQMGGKYSNEDLTYRVYKIDSINNYYLIYASKNDSLYKIVSKKETMKNCNRIQKNGEYDFKLHSTLSNRHIGNMDISAKSLPHVNCFYYDEQTYICLERDSINDLFHADNIKGLCFQK